MLTLQKITTVPQLKRISNELSTRTIDYRNNNQATATQSIIFFPPKSGARKSEWVSTIGAFFHLHSSNNNLYNILNGTTASAATNNARRPSPSRAATKKPSPAKKKSPSKAKSNAATAKKPSPTKARKKSQAKKKSPPKTNRTATTNATISSDEAMARSLQNQFMGWGPSQTWGNSYHQSWGGPLAYSHLQNGDNNTASLAANGNASEPSAGLKMPAKPSHVPVKVKKEPNTQQHTSTSHSAATSAETDSLQPRDFRETQMVSNLRGMGFTDTREILMALRAVAAEREEVSIVMPNSASMMGSGNAWSMQEQEEAAMMWIVQQREEAEEARKLDEARISSEAADVAMEQSRKQNLENELKNADMVDLLGSAQDDMEISVKSKHFPQSALLRHGSVKSVLKVIASSDRGKEQVTRLLSLEKKARKWYGTVLPFSYFEYELKPRLEGWVGEDAIILCRHESDALEQSMFNLSEQVEGGIGSVPKIFYNAQKEATEKGQPTSSPEDTKMSNDDDDIEVVDQPLPSKAGGSGNLTAGKSSVDIIDIA